MGSGALRDDLPGSHTGAPWRVTHVAVDGSGMPRRCYDDLATRLRVVPMSGALGQGDPWTKMKSGSSFHLLDDEGRFLIVSAVDDGRRRPVVTCWTRTRRRMLPEK